MIGIKGIADFEDRFFETAKKLGESGKLLKGEKGDIDKELESGKDFPVSLKADFSLLIGEINALEETRSLLKGVVEELQHDFSSLIKSKSFDDFADNFKDLVRVERLKEAPDVLRGIIHMEVGLALSFIAAMKNFETLRMKDYEDSFNQYFFSSNGYKTVSGDLIIRPKLPKKHTGDRRPNQCRTLHPGYDQNHG